MGCASWRWAGVGLLGAAAIAGTLRALLFEVGTRDLTVYLGGTAIASAVALAATYLAARSVVPGNPSEALVPD